MVTLLLIILILVVKWCGTVTIERQDETVRRLSTLPHGLARLSPAERATLGHMRAAPQDYLPALRARLQIGPDPRVMLEPVRQREFFGAVELLFALRDSMAFRTLQQLQDTVLERLDPEWRTIHRIEHGAPLAMPTFAAFLLRSEREILSGWETSGSRMGIPTALRLLVVADHATAMKALQYLAIVAPGDTAVAAQARAAIREPSAPLAGNPTAEALLGVLEGRTGKRGGTPR